VHCATFAGEKLRHNSARHEDRERDSGDCATIKR
jgi:hypothetical protein